MLRRHFMINTNSSIPDIPDIPNNEIWYTSSDGNIITLNSSDDFPTIVSNTYNDGKGVIKFETDLTTIESYAFRDCSSLTSIIIPNSVTSIGIAPFQRCSSLTSPVYNIHCFAYMPPSYSGAYAIPEGIKQIAGSAFFRCYSLTSVTIPNSVISIGGAAFEDISAKLLFSKLHSTYTNGIILRGSETNITCNIEFNISEIPTDYNISSMLKQQTGNKGTITYNIYTDYAPCKDQALALVNDKTIVNVYHIDGTPWT